MTLDPAVNDPSAKPAGTAPGVLLWRRLVAWIARHRVMRYFEIAVAVSALALGIVTYVAMTPGAMRELSPREIQFMLLSDLVALLALIAVVARRLVMLWMQRRRGAAGSRLHARLVVIFAVLSSLPAV